MHGALLIVPDDSLGTLPFEMLVLNDKGTIKTDKELPYISGAEFFGDRNRLELCRGFAISGRFAPESGVGTVPLTPNTT